MTQPDKRQLLESHEADWSNLGIWIGFFFAFFSVQGILAWAFIERAWWAAIPLIVLVGHLMHSHLLALHDASHGTLCPNRIINEGVGIFIGTLGLIEFSLFRAVHHTHHAYLGTSRDEEMWPFVNMEVPCWRRRVAAFLELSVGLFYTPCLLLRCFLRKGSPIIDPGVRARIWAELILMVAFWSGILALTAYAHAWSYLAVLYLAPALVAGNMQSWRKYIEHMGLTGDKVLSCTRTIIPNSWLGRLVVFTLMHEPYHGVHHKFPRLPHGRLPEWSFLLEPPIDDEVPPFPNFRTALWDMLWSLRDPRIGPQWRKYPSEDIIRAELGEPWSRSA
jgi:fatty acid desaturase